MRPSFLRALLVVSLASGSGCGLVLDVAPADPDAATRSFDAGRAFDGGVSTDAGPLEDACDDEGAQCPLGDALAVCVDGQCVPSTCGDGVRDPRSEACDDGNTIDNDGCPSDCRLGCETELDCPVEEGPCLDAVACVGGRCEQPSRPDGTPCVGASPGDAECRAGRCAPLLCGNGSVDAGEQCDDGNTIRGDGCEADCTFSCEADADCDDGLFCTGEERCELARHRCVGTARVCPPSDVCTSRRCDEANEACVAAPRDVDEDGHFCETDCAPEDVTIHPGATDDCDLVDDDCDGRVDEDATATVTCFVDADGDGFGASGSETARCTCPAGETMVGGDCYDHPTDPDAPLVNPDANTFHPDGYTRMPTDVESFDWNCSEEVELLFTETIGIGGELPTCDAPTAPGMCRADPRWASDVIPWCGGVGDLVRCVPELDRCVRQLVEDQAQRCR